MKVLFIGDIVGKSGRNALREHLPFLRNKYQYDLLIVNGENSAHGKGITQKIYNSYVELGVDVVTLGNHAFSKDNIYTFIGSADRLIRPVNMEPTGIGRSVRIIDYEGLKVGVYDVYGHAFMDNSTGMPIDAMNSLLDQYPSDIRIVDIHAETTGEKVAFMQYFKNDIQMIVGTHTHIQTADEGIYGRCAYITDAGMTGAFDSVLGRDTDEVLESMINGTQTRYTVSTAEGLLCGLYAEIDLEQRRAVAVERIQIRPDQQ